MANWTQSEIDYIRKNYGHVATSAIAEALGRSTNSVRIKSNRLNLAMENRGKFRLYKSPRYWTTEETQYLAEQYPNGNTQEIAVHFRKTLRAIRTHAMKSGIPKITAHWPKKPDEDKTYLINSSSFVLLTSSTAYSLGFLVADGNVGKRRIKFSNNNLEILMKIRETLGFDPSRCKIRKQRQGLLFSNHSR